MTSKRLAFKRNLRFLAGVLLALAVTVQGDRQAAAQDAAGNAAGNATSLDPKQTEAIQELVREYLLQNPEVIVEALEIYQQRQRLAEAERQHAALLAAQESLKNDPASPVLGNPDGDITVVEFFDYRCPYCRQVAGALQELVAEDPNIRLVMKEYPILSEESVNAARAALAAVRQDGYERFHFALMERGGSMTQAEVTRVARSVGLDVEQLLRDMRSPEIEAALRRNYALAESIGVTGTPAMVIGTTLVPGAVDLNRLRALVAEARAQAS